MEILLSACLCLISTSLHTHTTRLNYTYRYMGKRIIGAYTIHPHANNVRVGGQGQNHRGAHRIFFLNLLAKKKRKKFKYITCLDI